MPEHVIHKIFYVLLSAYTEFLPVSAYPHQILYENFTGITMNDAVVHAMLRLGSLVALLVACRVRIARLLRENRHARLSRRRKTSHVDQIALVDTRVIRTAVVFALFGLFLYGRFDSYLQGLPWLMLLMLINGAVVFLPALTASGNKNGLSMSRLDSVLVGLGGIFGIIPGFSKLGALQTACHLRGVDREYALDTALIVCIPLYFGLTIMDFMVAVAVPVMFSGLGLLFYGSLIVLSAAVGYLSIMVMRYFCTKSGFLSYSYYSWALALFTFILYLLIQ